MLSQVANRLAVRMATTSLYGRFSLHVLLAAQFDQELDRPEDHCVRAGRN